MPVTAQDLFQEILKWDSEKGDDKKLIVKIENMLSKARQEARREALKEMDEAHGVLRMLPDHPVETLRREYWN